jgi:6-phosphogluconate dehydrogenase
MGDHHRKSIEEIGAEITGQLVGTILTVGGNKDHGEIYDIQKAKQMGEAVRAIYEEVFKGVVGSLRSGKVSPVQERK